MEERKEWDTVLTRAIIEKKFAKLVF